MQRAFPIDPTRQQEIEPDQSRVMRLDGQADCKTKDARPHEPLLKKTPDGHHAKAYYEPGRIAGAKDSLAVDQQNTDQAEGELWRIARS